MQMPECVGAVKGAEFRLRVRLSRRALRAPARVPASVYLASRMLTHPHQATPRTRAHTVSTQLKTEGPGRYSGRLPMKGEGPFQLQLVSAEDAERVAQVSIPGSRAQERDVTVIGELGKERLFSMMPERGASPLRGGFVFEGDFLATPIIVDDVVSERFTLHVKKDVDGLKLLVLDLASGDLRVVDHGDAKAGDEILVDTESPLCTVFAGCVVGGQPFEGYSSFIRPSRIGIGIDVPRQFFRARISSSASP